jgi:hypothetical protein
MRIFIILLCQLCFLQVLGFDILGGGEEEEEDYYYDFETAPNHPFFSRVTSLRFANSKKKHFFSRNILGNWKIKVL